MGVRHKKIILSSKSNGDKVDNQALLIDLVDAFTFETDFNSYADFLLYCIEKHFGYTRTVLELIPRDSDKLLIASKRGLSEEFIAWSITELGSGISGKVAVNGRPMLVDDLTSNKNTAHYTRIFQKEGVYSLLSVPLAIKKKVIGAISIYGKERTTFTSDDISAILNAAGFAANFINFLYERDSIQDRLNRLERYNENLEKLKSFHDLILENVPIGVIATDVKGYVVLMNRELETMSLLRREDCPGKRWYDIFGFEGDIRHKLETSFRTSTPQLFPEINLPRKNGSTLPIEMKTDVIRDYSGERIGVVAICSNLDEKKKIEREIEKIERLAAIGKLSAGIAHEIRNPLAGISGALQAIREKIAGEPELEKVLKRVFKEINRLDSVVEKLHDVASPKKMVLDLYSISEIVEDSLFFIQKSIGGRKIRLLDRLDKSLKPIMMDRDAIRQVILNVMINAMNSMPQGGDLTVETSLLARAEVLGPEIIWYNAEHYRPAMPRPKKNAQPYQSVIITDKGIGISQTIVPKIFEAFFSTFSSGTGLGLYISARIVEQHQGLIGVKSRPGKGSAFYILLPVRSKQVSL